METFYRVMLQVYITNDNAYLINSEKQETYRNQ